MVLIWIFFFSFMLSYLRSPSVCVETYAQALTFPSWSSCNHHLGYWSSKTYGDHVIHHPNIDSSEKETLLIMILLSLVPASEMARLCDIFLVPSVIFHQSTVWQNTVFLVSWLKFLLQRLNSQEYKGKMVFRVTTLPTCRILRTCVFKLNLLAKIWDESIHTKWLFFMYRTWRCRGDKTDPTGSREVYIAQWLGTLPALPEDLVQHHP